MIRKAFCLALCALLFALCSTAEAQQPKKVYQIGYLVITDPATESTRAEAIRLALRELGYIEGQNIAVEIMNLYQYVDETIPRLLELPMTLKYASVLRKEEF